MLQHQTTRARPALQLLAARDPNSQPASPVRPPNTAVTLQYSYSADYPGSRLLPESPPHRAPSLCHGMPFPSRWEAISLQQMANIPQIGHGKKITGTKRREGQAHGKLHTQKRSHGSLCRASQRLSRLPFHLRQEPQLLVTDLLFHQKQQVTVQLPVQRCSIVIFISICQKPTHDGNKILWQHWSDPLDSSPLFASHPSSNNTQTWIHGTSKKCSRSL